MTPAAASLQPVERDADAVAEPRLRRASLPAELRGLRRDGVALTVVDPAGRSIEHTVFGDIGRWLRRGDLLLFNTSGVLPAALDVTRADGTAVQLRPAVRRADGWDALVVGPLPPHRPLALHRGEELHFPGGLTALVLGPRLDLPGVVRLRLDGAAGLDELLRHGSPIRYSYVPEPVPLEHYQTVLAGPPGSAESPSAGRPFTMELLLALRRRGIGISGLTLHTALSSLQDDDVDALHPLAEEWFSIPPETAEAVSAARGRGRVVAVGTTVVRALESAATGDHQVEAMSGWTSLRVTPSSRPRVADAVVTGLHEEGASHLDMLAAFADPGLLAEAHTQARVRGHLWHEFGDAMLILPSVARPASD